MLVIVDTEEKAEVAWEWQRLQSASESQGPAQYTVGVIKSQFLE